MSDLTLILVSPRSALCDLFREHFAPLPNVEVVKSYFQDMRRYDCLVNSGNSFGLMDGGIDSAIVAHFGEELRARVQAHILAEYLGEQPVGTSFIVETGHADHP